MIIANLVKFCPLKSVRFYSSICFIRFSMNTGLCPKLFIHSSYCLTAMLVVYTSLQSKLCVSKSSRFSKRLVGLDGLEPSTSRLSGARSNHLSYRPLFPVVLIRVISRHFASSTLSDSGSRSLAFRFLRAVIGCDTVAGGDDGNRTHDPLLAGQVLSQLSYTPI